MAICCPRWVVTILSPTLLLCAYDLYVNLIYKFIMHGAYGSSKCCNLSVCLSFTGHRRRNWEAEVGVQGGSPQFGWSPVLLVSTAKPHFLGVLMGHFNRICKLWQNDQSGSCRLTYPTVQLDRHKSKTVVSVWSILTSQQWSLVVNVGR